MRGGGDVIVLATRPPPPAPLPRGSGPEDAAAARREARAAEATEARRDGGVGTHAVARALQACLAAAGERHVTPSAVRPGAASSRYEPGGDDAPGKWADALRVMSDALRDLGSLRTPHLGSSRPLDPANDAVRVVHPLSEHGARRAVFVGVNYASGGGGEDHRRQRGASSSVRLRHREDDCRWMLETLAPRGFDDPDGARVLVDDGHEDGQPTKVNILRAVRWLTRRAQPGDSLAFHFSGRTASAEALEKRNAAADASYRGIRRRPLSTTTSVEDSAEDTTALLPCDFETAGAITRDELFASLIKPLPRGAKLFVVIDSPDANAADVVYTPFAFGERDIARPDPNQVGVSSAMLGTTLGSVSLRSAMDASSAVANKLFAEKNSFEKKNVARREKETRKKTDMSAGPETGCCVVS